MKPRFLRYFPRSFVVCLAPVLACTSVNAKVVYNNQSNGSNVWILPPGVNLLTGTIPSPSSAATHEGSDSTWTTVVDGSLGDAGGAPATSCTPNNNDSVTFPLDLTSKPGGYDITSFDSYCSWANSGRDNQDYALLYSTVADPTTFITIGAVNNRTGVDRSTHTRITDDTGFLAMGVHSIRVVFANNQENGYVGYREFVLQDASSTVCVSTEASDSNAFFLPGGSNLLTGITPVDAAPDTQEGSSADWATVTDASLGDYTMTDSSVTPSNGQTLTYALDIISKPAGYDITSFDSFCAWGSNGRDDQNYLLEYSTVGDPTTFIAITEVAAHTEYNGPNGRVSTHARVTGNGGPMATGVHSVRLTFHNQENGFTGFREFVLKDTPIVQTAYASNNTNSWTLPVGTNLLAGADTDPFFPDGSDHGNGDFTGSDWAILTDGSVGSAGNQGESVAPLNDTSVVFTLDTTLNTEGYNVTSFDSYAAWGDTGRDNQDFTILYSTVGDPATFVPIETVANHTNALVNATHTSVTDASGVLATNVGAVMFYFSNQENGYAGYREFSVQGNAVPLFSALTWTGLSGAAGDADWIDATDNNWTDGSGSSDYNSGAPLAFDDTGINTNIDIPSALTADSLTFTNDSTPYAFGGDTLTVTNGVTVSGPGSVVFDNTLEAAGLALSGTGSLTLTTSNTLTGSAVVSDGTLNLEDDYALGDAPLAVTGGTVNFISSNPSVLRVSGTGGSLVLGDPSGPGDTELWFGDDTSTSYAGSISDASAATTGSLYKAGYGTMTLTGANTYTGTTTVSEGELKLGQRLSLYNGNTASWTDSNIFVYTSLSLRVGGAGEFTSSDIAALDTGGFDFGSVLGLDTTSGDAEVSDNISGDAMIEKQGLNSLTLSGTNSFTDGITVTQGALNAANPAGISIPGNLTVGNVTFDCFANLLYDDQFGPESIVMFDTGPGAVGGKFQLRGTSQTVMGLESGTGNRIAIIQNDETSSPGYTANPGPCSLTIDTPEFDFFSFHGVIRNQDGDSLSLVKTGAGTQELINAQVEGNSYDGPTTVEEGTLLINFGGGNSGFGSDITVEAAGILNFHAAGGNYAFHREILGEGPVVVDGSSAVIFTNTNNSNSGGTTVGVGIYDGFLALDGGGGGTGAGTDVGQNCVGGAMIPSNVITVNGGATLSLDGTAALGESSVLPQYAPSIQINENSTLFGGTNTVAFVSNITLNGGFIQITDGAGTGGFNTDLTFVGTLVVGGDSILPSEIYTSGTGPNANASLGSTGLPGTTFQVADVTSDTTTDLVVSSILQDVGGATSPLTKTGPGTMALEGLNTYTGDTTVLEGELSVLGDSIADTNNVVLDGGKLAVLADETVTRLYYGASQQAAGTYGSTSSTAAIKDDTRFSGTGILTVLSSTGGSVTYDDWAMVIPDVNERDRTDDPDGDGFTNLEEFLFGTSPIDSNGTLSTMEDNGTSLTVRWNERETGDSVYVLQESTTMVDPWAVSTAPITDNAVQDIPDYIRKEAVVPVDSSIKFIRVHATE